MLTITGRETHRLCNGLSRRSFLQIGAFGGALTSLRKMDMNLSRSLMTGIGVALLFAALGQAADSSDPTKGIVAIVQKHCVECHGSDNQEGGLRFDKLTGNSAEAATWSSIYEQLKRGTMPPKEEPSLTGTEHSAIVGWIERNFTEAARSLARKLERPENGNLIPHEKLFDPRTAEQGPKIAASPVRIWRTLPASYRDKMDAWLKSQQVPMDWHPSETGPFPPPFGLQTAAELKNYSFLYTLEGPQTVALANNARLALGRALDADPKNEKNDTSLLRTLARAKEPPSDADIDRVIVDLYRHWAGRAPDSEELAAERAAVLESIKKLGNRDGLIAGLTPIMIHPEAFFHTELGTAPSIGEPTMLPPSELLNALDRALRDRRHGDPSRNLDAQWNITYGAPIARDFLVLAASQGKLQTREDVRAVLDEAFSHKKMPKLSQSETVRRFLQEYFNYTNYHNVFKCLKDLTVERKRFYGAFDERFDGGIPEKVVVRTQTVLDKILEEDQQVLARMLTIETDDHGRSVAALADVARHVEDRMGWIRQWLAANPNVNPEQVAQQKANLARLEKILLDYQANPRSLSNVWNPAHDDWVDIEQPAPARSGVLTQRSWLVGYSNNVQNDPIHRGKWIRERLLGGRIPDVPITVDATLPDDPTKTLRERMQKTRSGECWKCHRLMDPLGLPFERYDHFGNFREMELDRPVMTTGEIVESGDPKLDGPITGPDELVKKLAESERVRQVFVRYAFRFWMGRNETLDDARTIQNAYLAYKESDGSMSALLKSLLSSDAFLYRAGSVAQGDTP